MEIPGIVAKHAIVTDTCRANKGDSAVIDESLERLRAEAVEVMPNWAQGSGVKFHFALTVEYPK